MAIGTENAADTSEPDRWIAEARAGSSAALDNLLVLVAEHLKEELGDRRIRGLSPSRSGADLIQDTILVIRKKFPQFTKSTFGDLKRWARGIRYKRRQHCMRTHHKRTRSDKKQRILEAIALRRNLPSQVRPQAESVDAIEQHDEWERVLVALRQLKPHEQYILRLRFFDELSFGAIAHIVNSSEDAVSRACRRALNRLRGRLER